MKQIKIVKSVDCTPVVNLRGMVRISRTAVSLPAGISWEPLKIKPHAHLTISDKVESKNTIWTAKLVFKTCKEYGNRERMAYRCRLQDGSYRLLGTDERPYPMASVVEDMPESVTENQLNAVTIDWQSARFIPYIKE